MNGSDDRSDDRPDRLPAAPGPLFGDVSPEVEAPGADHPVAISDRDPKAADDGSPSAAHDADPWLPDDADLPAGDDEPAPSAFVLPLGALLLAAFLLRWAVAAWRGAPEQWWDPLLAAAAGLAALAYGLARLRPAVGSLAAFAAALRPEPPATPVSPLAEDGGLADGLRHEDGPRLEDGLRLEGGEGFEGQDRASLVADGDRPDGATDASWAAAPVLTPLAAGRRRPDLRARWSELVAGLRRPVDAPPWLPRLVATSPWRLTAACALGAMALGLALFAQLRLDAQALTVAEQVPVLATTTFFLLLWALVMAAAMEALAPETVSDPVFAAVPARVGGGRRGWALATMGLALALVTVAFSARLGAEPPPIALLRPAALYTNATLQPLGLLLWLAGLAALLVALQERGRSLFELFGGWIGALRRPESWLLLAILGLAAWLRFHNLALVPAEMTSDHTEKLNDVRTMLEGGLRPVFLPGNAGREAMEFYWLAFLMGPLGLPVSFQTMKVAMGLVSLLNVVVLYRLGRELGGATLALTAAFLLAVSPWHLLITRIGLRIAFAPLWVTVVAWLLLRAIRSGRRNDWLALGASMALGVYGYTAYRAFLVVVPVMIAAKLLHDRWYHRGEGRRLVPVGLPGHVIAAALVGLVLILPLWRYSQDYAELFNHRAVTRLVGDAPLSAAEFDTVLDQNLKTQLLPNIRRALWMFNLTADSSWFQSPPGRPALDTVAGALFLLGLAIVLVRAFRRDWRYLVLAAALPLMLATSFLAIAFPRENPSLSRASGAMPLALLIAALPLPGLAARWRAALGRRGLAGAALASAALLVWMTLGSWQRYFVDYRDNYDQSTHPTSEGAAEARRFISEQGGDFGHVYYVGWEHGWDHRALAYLMGAPTWNGLLSGSRPDWSDAATAAQAHVSDAAPKLYLVGGPFAAAQIDTLKGFFPTALVAEHKTRMPGKDFWTVIVPPRGEGATP